MSDSERRPGASSVTGSSGCCGNAAQPSSAMPHRDAGPCCGSAADAAAEGACCDSAAKSEAVAAGRGCCG